MAFIKKVKRKWQGREKWTLTTVTQGKPVSTKELCDYIADSTTASKGDVYNVLMSLPKVMVLFMKNGRSVRLEDIGTFRYGITAGMVDREEEVGEELIREVRVKFAPERTVTVVGKQRITHRALIPDGLTWEIYDKPGRKKTATGGGNTPTPGGNGGTTTGGNTGGSTGGNGGNGE